MAFITSASLKKSLAGIIKHDSTDLESYWDEIVDKSNTAAYQDIVRRLMARGYTKDQVDDWDHGAEYETDIGLYWCLVKGAGLHTVEDKLIDLLDRREELDECQVIIDDESADPADSSGNTVGTGYLDETDSIFSMGLDDEDTATEL